MTAGFKDLLAWLLGWKSSYAPSIGGPYQIVAGQTFEAGAIIGQNYHPGATAGLCNG
jgi:hypothetical protein